MKRSHLPLALWLFPFLACTTIQSITVSPAPTTSPPVSVTGVTSIPSVTPSQLPAMPLPAGKLTSPGGELITHIKSEGIGDIAVQVLTPHTPRYADGAGVVVIISTFFTEPKGLRSDIDFTAAGLIQVTYLWPGKTDRTGVSSEGNWDYGGETAIQALRDVIRFASGQIPDKDGHFLGEMIAIKPLSDNVGLYAFSHPGIAAVNVLALYGDQLLGVHYFIAREAPTLDTISTVEIGYFSDDGQPVYNPLYTYPESYGATAIHIDYRTARWDASYHQPEANFTGRAYLDLDESHTITPGDHVFNYKIPTMFGKRYYSVALTQALQDNQAIPPSNWPADLATPQEAATIWPFRSSVQRYAELCSKVPQLKVMLVFAQKDHIQPAIDKPHIHQAYQGFHATAGLWTRLNPDLAYIHWSFPETRHNFPDNPANSEPADWKEIGQWSYPNQPGSSTFAPLAAVAEMADRTHENQWSDNLEQVMVEYPTPSLKP